MCNFISWIEYEGNNYYLTNADLETKQGQRLLEDGYRDDIEGHGAIQHYYPELKGKGIHRECEDFSSPDNFPPEIARDLMAGKLSNIGIAVGVLNEKGKEKFEKIINSAWVDYEKIQNSARADYEKIQNSAWVDYEKIQNSARADYEKIQNSARADYEKIKESALADYLKIKESALADYLKIKESARAEYEKIEESAWADYLKIQNSAWADYEKIKNSARAEYEKIVNPARAEYEKKCREAWLGLVKYKKYRIKEWKVN